MIINKKRFLPWSFLFTTNLIIGFISRIYLTFLIGFFISIFFNIIILILEKKIISIIYIFVFIASFFYIEKHANNFIENQNKILKSNEIMGIIVAKEPKENKFSYLINIYKYKDNENDTYDKIKGYVYLISKENLDISNFIKAKYIHWFSNKQYFDKKNINTFKNIDFQKGILAYGCSYNIYQYKENEKVILNLIYKTLYKIKENTIKFAEKYLDKETISVFKSVFLGKNLIEKEDRDLFTLWGIVHYLARSGLHVQIINIFLLTILSFFGIPFRKSLFFSIIFLLFFYLVSFSSIPFNRACIMLLISFIFQQLNVCQTQLHVFSICSLFYLILSPLSLFSLSFQLSFFATCILILINFYKNNQKT
jgi:competence protein ComEC